MQRGTANQEITEEMVRAMLAKWFDDSSIAPSRNLREYWINRMFRIGYSALQAALEVAPPPYVDRRAIISQKQGPLGS